MARSSTTFQPGHSGNPRGRPTGSGRLTSLRTGLENALPEILDVLIDRAKEGDVQAARLLLERAIPPLRPVSAPLSLPKSSTLGERGESALDAVMSGRLPADQGLTLLSAIHTQAKVIESTELATRLDAIEALLGVPDANKPSQTA